MKTPRISATVAILVMLQLAPISSVEAEECVQPGGCASCGLEIKTSGGGYHLLRADEAALLTLNTYLESKLGIPTALGMAGHGLQADPNNVQGCLDVARTLGAVMGWVYPTNLICTRYKPPLENQDSHVLGMKTCKSTPSKIQELVKTIHCNSKPNGCIYCLGDTGAELPQADDRALAALNDIVTKAGSSVQWGKGGKQGNPVGIWAVGGEVGPCDDALTILKGKVSGADGLTCSTADKAQLGYILGCDKPDAIEALQRLIDDHIPMTSTTIATITTTTAATTTTAPFSTSFPDPASDLSQLLCNLGSLLTHRCINVQATDGKVTRASPVTEFLNAYYNIHRPAHDTSINDRPLECGVKHELIPVSEITVENLERCLAFVASARLKDVLQCVFDDDNDDAHTLLKLDCGNVGRVKALTLDPTTTTAAVTTASTPSTVATTFRPLDTNFGTLDEADDCIVDTGCKEDDTSPATIAMTAFFLSEGLDIYVRCEDNGEGHLRMAGKDIDLAAEALDEAHKAMPGNSGPVPGQTYHISFTPQDQGENEYAQLELIATGPEIDAVIFNIQEVLTAFSKTVNEATATTTTPATSFPDPAAEGSQLSCEDNFATNLTSTADCINVQTTDGKIIRASPVTEFLNEYYTNHHSVQGVSGNDRPFKCSAEANDNGFYNIVINNRESCEMFLSTQNVPNGGVTCTDKNGDVPDSEFQNVYLRYISKVVHVVASTRLARREVAVLC